MSMAGDDLSVELFFWGTALALGLAALTLAGSKRILVIKTLWCAAAAFVLAALFWPMSSEWPALRSLVDGVAASRISLDVVGLVIFGLIIFDFRIRSNLFRKHNPNSEPSDKWQQELGKLETAVGTLERNTIRNNQKLLAYETDPPVLMEIVIEHLALSLLHGVPERPSFTEMLSSLTPESAEAERKRADEYSEGIRHILGSTQWGMFVRSIIGQADSEGEYALRQIPQNERPEGIDALDLRRYMIAKIKCKSLWRFIQAERNESSAKYLNYLQLLKERLEARKAMIQNMGRGT